MRLTAALAAFAVLVVAFGPRPGGGSNAPAESTLVFVSEFGDPIGQGRTRSFNAVATAYAAGQSVRVQLHDEGSGDGALASAPYALVLQAPAGEALRPGVYTVDGTLAAGEPRMHLRGGGRSCDRIEGRFEIQSIELAPDGSVEQLSARFEQRCNGAFATLWGEVFVRGQHDADQRIRGAAPIARR